MYDFGQSMLNSWLVMRGIYVHRRLLCSIGGEFIPLSNYNVITGHHQLSDAASTAHRSNGAEQRCMLMVPSARNGHKGHQRCLLFNKMELGNASESSSHYLTIEITPVPRID